MSLMLSDVHQLVITQGSAILESHSLLSARNWMRGLCRNDSLLFMCRIQVSGKTEVRKFRVRFCADGSSSACDQCRVCVEKLHQFFPIKTSVAKSSADDVPSQNDVSGSLEASSTGHQQKTLEGEVTLGHLAQNLLSSERLPLAYTQHHTSPETLQQMLRMCLADPAFPAFVHSVESELNNIVQGSGGHSQGQG
ncbi:meiotic recombination protein REC114-like [Elysia marginata]|uniref:Meiotic recombination protein REC114-like n=1 Tax=Elysia marginata TaxID=1093978 RepID=A0AAV4G156_9GAST|nr:meiotic recombination protein REC114-like [Elysia marginata]